MALELNTDGNATTSTTGETTDYKLGDTNTSTVGFVYGFTTFMFGLYFTFIRVVTGLTIDIQTPISISIFGGFRFVVQGGACYTLSKIQELNAKADVMTKITNLQELLSSQTQIIDTSTQTFINLIQKINEKISNYDVEEKNGDTSTEEWNISKSITSGNYSLKCEEGAILSVDHAWVIVAPNGVDISGPLIDIGD